MKLTFFLPLGGSLESMFGKGEYSRFRNYYLCRYAKTFRPLYIVSYGKDDATMGKPYAEVLINQYGFHRYIWQVLLPFFYKKQLADSVYRVTQLDGLLPAIIGKLLYGGKVAVTYGYDYQRFALLEKKRIQAYLYILFERFLLSYVDLIISPTKMIFQRLSARFTNKVIHLPNGVDTSIFSPSKRRRRPKNKINILAIGSLKVLKNFGLLIEGVALLQDKNKVSLTIIGSGNQREQLRQKAVSMGVDLTIIPSVPYEELPQFYQLADIYVSTSLSEGSPKALLEAMSCGCCCLVSDVPGNQEIIVSGENGVLYPLDSARLAKELELLLVNQKLRNKLAKAARETIVSDYNLKKILDREIGLIKNLL